MLAKIIDNQKVLQESILKHKLEESPLLMYHSATAAIVEIGEMLQEDTRWKEFVTGSKNLKTDKEKFVEEYCDVLLYWINVALFSGISYEDVLMTLKKKQQINFERFLK